MHVCMYVEWYLDLRLQEKSLSTVNIHDVACGTMHTEGMIMR